MKVVRINLLLFESFYHLKYNMLVMDVEAVEPFSETKIKTFNIIITNVTSFNRINNNGYRFISQNVLLVTKFVCLLWLWARTYLHLTALGDAVMRNLTTEGSDQNTIYQGITHIVAVGCAIFPVLGRKF
jgi:hypothetical protein